jgi:hypothetical protein
VSGIATACVEDFLESNDIETYECSTDPTQTAKVAPAAAADVQAAIVQAITNVRTAMADAGHTPADYTLVVQTYPQPIPHAASFRYPETGYTRQTTGGCGFWDVDADWMVDTVMATVNATVRSAIDQARSTQGPIELLELQPTLDDRRLCDDTVGLLAEEGLTSWTQTGAVDVTEWINAIDIDTGTGPHFEQESLHPNYWAQLGLRNCLRQVWNDGTPRSGTCVRGLGLNTSGEPNMSLEGDLGGPAPSTGTGTGANTGAGTTDPATQAALVPAFTG